MTAYPSCVCRSLPATRTYPRFGDRRAYYWSRPDSCRGVLLVEQRSKAAVYVTEENTDAAFPAREWLLAKESDAGEVYAVTLDGGAWRCTCTGFTGHRGEFGCVHSDAIRELFLNGDLDPADDAGGPRYDDAPGEPTAWELEQGVVG